MNYKYKYNKYKLKYLQIKKLIKKLKGGSNSFNNNPFAALEEASSVMSPAQRYRQAQQVSPAPKTPAPKTSAHEASPVYEASPIYEASPVYEASPILSSAERIMNIELQRSQV